MRCQGISGADGLQSLDLRDTQVSDDGLRHLRILDNLQIADAGSPRLFDLANLQSVSLRNTPAADSGEEERRSHLPETTIIR